MAVTKPRRQWWWPSTSNTHPRTNFDGGDVRHWVHVLHGGVVRVPVGELHSHSPLVGHNVCVGDDEAVSADDEPRAVGHWDFPARERVPVEQQGRTLDRAAVSTPHCCTSDWVVV